MLESWGCGLYTSFYGINYYNKMVFDILFTYGSQIINLSHNILAIGQFRIPGRPRKSACFCAKARLLRVTSHQEDKQT